MIPAINHPEHGHQLQHQFCNPWLPIHAILKCASIGVLLFGGFFVLVFAKPIKAVSDMLCSLH